MWILVVEDDIPMGDLLRRGLEEANHSVALTRTGPEGLHAAETSRFDAAILDVMLPGLDGVEIARKLRATGSDLAILMLTARDAPSDVVRGLDAGADDYLTKPFSLKVLLARLRAISRRAGNPPVSLLKTDDLALDPDARTVHRAGRPINLTATEFRLLEFLMRRAGRVASRTAIIDAIWGFDEDVEPNTVDVFIKLLRDKVDAGHPHRLIQTVRGFGYIVRESV